MTKRFSKITLAVLAFAGLLSACHQKPAPSAGRPAPAPSQAGLDINKLNTLVDAEIGGLGTCVVLLDTQSGRDVYRYGDARICLAKLPPCATFDIANGLIGLDQGVITPQTVYKWDGSPQPFTLWQRDADFSQAFKMQNGWWFQRLAGAIGHDHYVERLRAFDYGSHDPAGMTGAFWQGPQAGGFLTITPGQQADFIRRFYASDLPAKPQSLATIQALTWDETRPEPKGGQAVVSGRGASCSSVPDGSRRVGWWVGRVKAPAQDLSFAVTIEGVEAPPGIEIERRMKDIFAQVGLLPAEA